MSYTSLHPDKQITCVSTLMVHIFNWTIEHTCTMKDWLCVCVCVCAHTHTHIYIYTHTHQLLSWFYQKVSSGKLSENDWDKWIHMYKCTIEINMFPYNDNCYCACIYVFVCLTVFLKSLFSETCIVNFWFLFISSNLLFVCIEYFFNIYFFVSLELFSFFQ